MTSTLAGHELALAGSPADRRSARRRLARAQEATLLLTIVGASTALVPGLIELVMLPKLTALMLGAATLACLGLAGLGHSRVGHGRRAPAALVALFFLLVAMTVATVSSQDSATSLLGRYGRYGGMLSYLSAGVLMAFIAQRYRNRSLRGVTVALLAALSMVLGYGLLQVLGLDPLAWRVGLDEPVFSFMGNTNFASAYVAVVSPLVLVVACAASGCWRAAAGVLYALVVIYAVVLQATQGLVCIVVGAGLVATYLLMTHRQRAAAVVRKHLLRSAILGAAAMGLLATIGLRVVQDMPSSLGQRSQLWAAGLAMYRDRPLLGFGLDSYGDHFLAYRPPSHARERGLAFVDAAHQVPLSMFVSGGSLLGVAYLIFISTVLLTLITGLRRVDPTRGLLLCGYGAALVCYHVQSLVSIDVPPLIMLHFVLAGGVVALATSSRPPALYPRKQRLPIRLSAYGLASVGFIVVAPIALQPLAADAAATAAFNTAVEGDTAEAVTEGRRAVRLNPWEPSYRRALGKRLASTAPEEGLAQLERAAELEYGSVTYARDALRQAAEIGNLAAVSYWYDELARRDPLNVDVLMQVAQRALDEGRPAQAQPLLEQVVRLRPDQVSAYYVLALTHTAQRDLEGARHVYEELLEAHPGDAVARRWLSQNPR